MVSKANCEVVRQWNNSDQRKFMLICETARREDNTGICRWPSPCLEAPCMDRRNQIECYGSVRKEGYRHS